MASINRLCVTASGFFHIKYTKSLSLYNKIINLCVSSCIFPKTSTIEHVSEHCIKISNRQRIFWVFACDFSTQTVYFPLCFLNRNDFWMAERPLQAQQFLQIHACKYRVQQRQRYKISVKNIPVDIPPLFPWRLFTWQQSLCRKKAVVFLPALFSPTVIIQ